MFGVVVHGVFKNYFLFENTLKYFYFIFLHHNIKIIN
jgi:hypothetical protein